MKFEDVVLGFGVVGTAGCLLYVAKPMLKAFPEAMRHASESFTRLFGGLR